MHTASCSRSHPQVANPKEILLFQKTKVKRKEEREAALRAQANGEPPPLRPDEEDPSVTVRA